MKTEKPKCTLTDAELIEKCQEWISSLCESGGQSWMLSIPVRLNKDPDMLFSELIERFKQHQQPPALTEDQMEQEAREFADSEPFFEPPSKMTASEWKIAFESYKAALQSHAQPAPVADGVKVLLYPHVSHDEKVKELLATGVIHYSKIDNCYEFYSSGLSCHGITFESFENFVDHVYTSLLEPLTPPQP